MRAAQRVLAASGKDPLSPTKGPRLRPDSVLIGKAKPKKRVAKKGTVAEDVAQPAAELAPKPSAVCFTGSRTWSLREPVFDVLEQLPVGTEISVGDCKFGLDKMVLAEGKGLGFRIRVFIARWDAHKRAAGPIRNREMLMSTRPSVLYAFIDDLNTTGSPGPMDCITTAESLGIQVVKYYASQFEEDE